LDYYNLDTFLVGIPRTDATGRRKKKEKYEAPSSDEESTS